MFFKTTFNLFERNNFYKIRVMEPKKNGRTGNLVHGFLKSAWKWPPLQAVITFSTIWSSCQHFFFKVEWKIRRFVIITESCKWEGVIGMLIFFNKKLKTMVLINTATNHALFERTGIEVYRKFQACWHLQVVLFCVLSLLLSSKPEKGVQTMH